MMQDSGCLNDSNIDWKELDILFLKVNWNKQNMDFPQFLHLLSKVASIRFPEYPLKLALRKLVDSFLIPLHDFIVKSKHNDKEMQKDIITEKVLKHVIQILHAIYVRYFEYETKHSVTEPLKIISGSESDLYKFLWEFDICPSLISKSNVCDIWTQVIEKSMSEWTPVYWETAVNASSGGKLEGKVFTFGFFLDFLVMVTQVAYVDEVSREKMSISEGICLLLEWMELSKGFVRFQQQTSWPQTSKNSLLPSKALLTAV